MNELLLLLTLLSSNGQKEITPVVDQRVSIKKGASLKETLIAYGRPFEASEETSYVDGHKYLQLIYTNDVCAGGSCSVIVENNQVVKLIGIRPDLSL